MIARDIGAGQTQIALAPAPDREHGGGDADHTAPAPVDDLEADVRHSLDRRRKAPYRLVLTGEALEDGQEFRDRQEVVYALRQVQQLERAAGTTEGGVAAHDFSDTRAV